ncbi:uncharacterized protein LOC124264616 [Haliotis rubra]|uniref:uncharacterized protein LOC124264616 n=1 Tax=Haliotis rubra TaxID=36100 RepID=UPI001EE625B6|nr:uncharacterized protein LOC124264616 [Haliotis rubra]
MTDPCGDVTLADYYSNSLNVVVLTPTTVAAPITTAPHHGPISTELPSGFPNVYIIAGSSAGLLIIIVLIGFAVVRMKHTAVARDEEPEAVKDDHKEEESGNDKAMVDNVCYVGFVEVGGDTTEEAPQGCVSDAHNMSGLQERRTLSLESCHIDDDLYAKPVKKADRKVMMDCSLGNQ